MIRVNIHEAKTHFSEYLAKLEEGESIVICKRNIAIAELRAIPHRLVNPRPVGLAKNNTSFNIPAAFFDPLPDDIIKPFESDES